MKNKNILYIALGTIGILLIPLIAMQFTNEVAWDLFDFVLMGILLFGIGLAYELISRKAKSRDYRIAVGIAGVTSLVLIWMNGAVGIIGSEDNPANLLYGGVIIIEIIGIIISRLKPRGMAWALLATAIAQFLVPIIALIIWRPNFSLGMVAIFVLNLVFVALWIGSASFFQHAGRKV